MKTVTMNRLVPQESIPRKRCLEELRERNNKAVQLMLNYSGFDLIDDYIAHDSANKHRYEFGDYASSLKRGAITSAGKEINLSIETTRQIFCKAVRVGRKRFTPFILGYH